MMMRGPILWKDLSSDDLSFAPARPETPQGSTQLHLHLNTFLTAKPRSLSAGAALAKDTELMGVNQEKGLLLVSVGGRKDQC